LSYKRQFHQAISELVQANAIHTLAFLIERGRDIALSCRDGGQPCAVCLCRHDCRLFLLTYVPRLQSRIIE